jgi:predicted MFS family arabinose efflux permease
LIFRVIDGYKHAFSGIPRRVWFLSLIALINRAGTMVLPFMSLYLVDKLKFSASQVSLVLFAYGLGSVFGSYIGGRLCRWFSTFSVILGSLLLGGISIISISFFGTFAGIITTFFLATDLLRQKHTKTSLSVSIKTTKSIILLYLRSH